MISELLIKIEVFREVMSIGLIKTYQHFRDTSAPIIGAKKHCPKDGRENVPSKLYGIVSWKTNILTMHLAHPRSFSQSVKKKYHKQKLISY